MHVNMYGFRNGRLQQKKWIQHVEKDLKATGKMNRKDNAKSRHLFTKGYFKGNSKSTKGCSAFCGLRVTQISPQKVSN